MIGNGMNWNKTLLSMHTLYPYLVLNDILRNGFSMFYINIYIVTYVLYTMYIARMFIKAPTVELELQSNKPPTYINRSFIGAILLATIAVYSKGLLTGALGFTGAYLYLYYHEQYHLNLFFFFRVPFRYRRGCVVGSYKDVGRPVLAKKLTDNFYVT